MSTNCLSLPTRTVLDGLVTGRETLHGLSNSDVPVVGGAIDASNAQRHSAERTSLATPAEVQNWYAVTSPYGSWLLKELQRCGRRYHIDQSPKTLLGIRSIGGIFQGRPINPARSSSCRCAMARDHKLASASTVPTAGAFLIGHLSQAWSRDSGQHITYY